jgi:hypothetical protein
METETRDDAEISAATARLAAMGTFRDGEASRRQIGTQLGPLEADFARCLALSEADLVKALRIVVYALPIQT